MLRQSRRQFSIEFEQLTGGRELTSPDDIPDSIGERARAINWLFHQPAQTVLLFIIVVGGGYMAWSGIPAHLAQIQAGYQALQSSFEKQMDKTEIAHSKEIERLSAAVDKSCEAINKQSAVLERRSQSIDDLVTELRREKQK